MSERRLSDDSSVPDNERSSLFEDVLLTHIQRQLQGEDVFDDDLVAQHPELMPELEERLQLFREMADLRDANEALDSAISGSDTGMLNVRCPHCRESVRVPADSSLINITCSGCGSRFSVADENSAQTQAATLTTQLGHFDLVEQIGAGSFGTVWKARDNELDRWVAVKIPRQGKLHAREATQFLREARAAAQLSHPNIVSVYEVGREDDTVFIVSDLVQGVSLSDWLTGQQPTIRDTCKLCVTIANALHHAHEAGVIHRDLKPQNIMLDAVGEPHLLDFGLARRNTGEITMTIDGNVLGTPAYMPPEQARGDARQVDRRADIYSLGVILFELLTGELPFRGNARMLIHQMLNEEPPSPRKLNSAVSKDLETACLKCLEKEPNKRYESAQEVADELQRILNGEAIHARPISRMDRVVRWCRRKPLLAVLVLVLVTVAIGGPILAVTQTQLRLSADRATVRANEERYVSDMNLAAQAWNAGDVRRTQELLAIHDPRTADQASHGFERFRGLPRFEWRLLWGLAHADQAASGRPSNVVIGADSAALAVVTGDGRLRVRSIQAEDRDDVLQQQGIVVCLAVSPDGQTLATTNPHHYAVKLWDMPGGELIDSIDGKKQKKKQNVAFSPDRKWLALMSFEGQLQLWDRSTPLERLQTIGDVGSDSVTFGRNLTFSHDSKLLAFSGKNGTVIIWDVAKREEIHSLPDHSASRPVAFGAYDKVIATGSSKLVRIWDVRSGRLLASIQVRGELRDLCFSPNGKLLAATSGDTELDWWDVSDPTKPRELIPLQGHTAWISTVAFSPDGTLLATGGADNTLRLWDVALGRQLAVLRGHTSTLARLAWSPDGNTIYTGSGDATCRIWHAPSWTEIEAAEARQKSGGQFPMDTLGPHAD